MHDFEGGNSPEAEKILGGRRHGVSRASKYASFLVRQPSVSGLLRLDLTVFEQMLMLLRRFPILNELPITAIQSQGLAKTAIQVKPPLRAFLNIQLILYLRPG